MVELCRRTFVMVDQKPDEIVRLSALVLDALHFVGCRPDAPLVVTIHESNDSGHDATDRQHGSGQCADGQDEPLRSSLALEEALPPGLLPLVILTLPSSVHADTLASG